MWVVGLSVATRLLLSMCSKVVFPALSKPKNNTLAFFLWNPMQINPARKAKNDTQIGKNVAEPVPQKHCKTKESKGAKLNSESMSGGGGGF